MKKKIWNIVKVICFLALFCAIGLEATSVMGISNIYSEHAEMMVNGYYETDEDTVDVLFVGNSHVYRYWQGAFAWKEYGLASLALSTSDMPYSVVKDVAIEALKTQNPKLIVFDLTSFVKSNDNADNADSLNKIYLLLNNLKFSKNYLNIISDFCYYNDITGKDMLQYYLPLIQFHDRWSEMAERDFVQTQESYLNSCYEDQFLTYAITDSTHAYTDESGKMEDDCMEALCDICEWINDELDCEVLFYVAPTVRSEWALKRWNAAADVVKSYGIDVIDFNDEGEYELFGFDDLTDFQDANHTNVKGSYKFTNYFAQYIMDTYGIESHTGEAAYASWDEKADAYYDIVSEYLWPTETDEEEE